MSAALFRKYHMTDKLGVALVHRHFDLRADEIMVDFRGVATAWGTKTLGQYKNIGKVLPLSWVVVDGRIRPYEFYFTTDMSETQVDIPAELAAEFDTLAKSHNLDAVLGFRVLGGSETGTMEFTERHVTFTVPWDSKTSSYTSGVSVFTTCWSYTRSGDEPASKAAGCGHSRCYHCSHPVVSCNHVPGGGYWLAQS